MDLYKRTPKRKQKQIKLDIESSGKIVREDVYDVLKSSKNAGMSRQQAKVELRKFINSIDQNSIGDYFKKHKTANHIAERIIRDIDSYGIDWEDDNSR